MVPRKKENKQSPLNIVPQTNGGTERGPYAELRSVSIALLFLEQQKNYLEASVQLMAPLHWTQPCKRSERMAPLV